MGKLYSIFKEKVERAYGDISVVLGDFPPKEEYKRSQILEDSIEEMGYFCDVIPEPTGDITVVVAKFRILLHHGIYSPSIIFENEESLKAFMEEIEKKILQAEKQIGRDVVCESNESNESNDVVEKFKKGECLLILNKENIGDFVRVVLEVADRLPPFVEEEIIGFEAINKFVKK